MSSENNNVIKQKVEKVQKIYNDYISEIKKLRLRQEQLVIDFVKNKEEEKLRKIRQSIKDNF